MANLQQTWDNSYFYTGSDDPQIAATVDRLRAEIKTLADLCAPFGEFIEAGEPLAESQFEDLLTQVRAAHQQRTETAKLLGNLRTFISSILSVDSRDAKASEWKPTLQQLGAEISQATKALDIFLLRVNDDFMDALVADPVLEELRFSLWHQRRLNDQLLSLAEEKLITGLAVNGL